MVYLINFGGAAATLLVFIVIAARIRFFYDKKLKIVRERFSSDSIMTRIICSGLIIFYYTGISEAINHFFPKEKASEIGDFLYAVIFIAIYVICFIPFCAVIYLIGRIYTFLGRQFAYQTLIKRGILSKKAIKKFFTGKEDDAEFARILSEIAPKI